MGGEVFGLSHHAATDAFHVGIDAPLTEQGFALRAFEDFASAVNPAGTPTEGVGGVEQIAHHKRTVVEIGGLCAIGQDDHDHRGAVERIAVATEDFGVEARELIAHGAVGDHHDERRLPTAARRGVGAGIGDALQVGMSGEHVGSETFDAATREEHVESFHRVWVRGEVQLPRARRHSGGSARGRRGNGRNGDLSMAQSYDFLCGQRPTGRGNCENNCIFAP